MKIGNVRFKRTIITMLSLALVWMFLLPVQAFAEDSGNQGASTPINEPVEEVIPAVNPEIIPEENVEEPGGEIIEEPVEEIIEEPVEEIIEEPVEEIIEEPVEEIIEEPVEEIIEEPVEEIIEEPVEEPVEEPGEEIVEQPDEEIVEDPGDEIVEEPGDEIVEEPDDEIVEEPGDEIIEEPDEEIDDVPDEAADSNAVTSGSAYLVPSTESQPDAGWSTWGRNRSAEPAANEKASGAVADNAGEWKHYDNGENANAIQQAVDAAIAAGQKYITVVVQDGTYTGGLNIDNSGNETIVVNIVAHDAYDHSTTSGGETESPTAIYPVPTVTDTDGNTVIDNTAIHSNSAGGVKLEDGVSVKNVELLLAGIYLTLKEQKENQGKIEAALTDKGNVDVKVENAEKFTYYGTSQGDSANITLTDVKDVTVNTGEGDDTIDITTTISPNVELDTGKTDAELNSFFSGAASVDSSVTVSSGNGNDKITVTENSSVTSSSDKKTVSVRKGRNMLTVNAGDGADTITLKGGSSLADIKKNISEDIAKKVYGIVSNNVVSSATIVGGADDDLLNLDTTFELGGLGQTSVVYQGEGGKNRLHLTGTLADVNDRVTGSLDANGSGNITMHSEHTVTRTDETGVTANLVVRKDVTELVLRSAKPFNVQMSGVDAITDDLAGKKTVNVTISNGKVMAGSQEVSFQAFTDYVYDPSSDTVNLGNLSNTSAGGLLSKLIIRGQNLLVAQNQTVHLPGVTLVLEAVDGAYESGSITVQGTVEAENIMLKLTSTDSHNISFVENDGSGVDPTFMDINTSATVTIAETARLIATRVVDIVAKSIQNHGLLPDLTDLIPGLGAMTQLEVDDKVESVFGFKSMELLKEAASINFVSVKMASAIIDILGSISAGSVRISASNKVDTSAANTGLRDLGLPFALSVILGEAGIKVSKNALIEAKTGDVYLDATSDITVNTTAKSGRLPFTVAVAVVDNKAYVDISGGTLRSTNGNIIANATGIVNMNTIATGTGESKENNNNAVVPSDNQASNTTTQLDMGKSGGFFAISVLNQDVFSALRGAANAVAKGDITVNSTAKASVVNKATSNPEEDGESMTLIKLIKTLAGDEKIPGDGGLIGKILGKVEKNTEQKKNQTASDEAKAAAEKQKAKKTSALGNFLDKLTGTAENPDGDNVGSLVDKATSSANTGKTDSTHTVQLVGALGITYANNNNKAYIETDGEVTAVGKLAVLANGEMKVETLADGSPVKADDPGAGDKKGPQDQHYASHNHGVVKVDKLTNGTIIIDASVGEDRIAEDGSKIYKVVQNNSFPDGIENYDVINFVVKASFGYTLPKDEDGFYINNDYKNVMDDSQKSEKIYVDLIGKDAEGCYLFKSRDMGYSGYKVTSGDNLFKAEFVPKNAITVNNTAPVLGTVEITDAQTNGRTLYYADQGESVYVKVNIKSGVTFTAPYITYLAEGSTTAQPVTFTEIVKGDVQEDGTVDYYYGFKMPEGKVTVQVDLKGDPMEITVTKPNGQGDVYINSADAAEMGNAVTSYQGNVGQKIKVVIQLPKVTETTGQKQLYMLANSLMFAGKTPVYIKDITYNGNGQYTCYVNIPAILKTEGSEDAGNKLTLTYKTTTDPHNSQKTVENRGTALGAGLAVDVTRYNNQAYITNTKDNTITAGSIEVKADTANLSASATSKAGFVAADLGVAGAITVHLVSANNEALIGGNMKSINVNNGDLIVDSKIQNSNVVTNALASGDGADGSKTDPNSVGVGAGIAVGVTNLAVVSRILDSVAIGGAIRDLTINAGHTGSESMGASAGASGGTSAVPVLAMNISGVSVLADSGRKLDNVLNITRNALINAANSISRTITADAAAVGGGVGVGASFIIDILNDSANAKLGRSVKAGNDLTVSADSVSRLNATAKSGAKGSVSDADGDGDSGGDGNGSGSSGEEPPPSVDLPDDYYDGLDNLFGEGSTDNNLDDDDDAESLAPLFKEGDADQFVDSNKKSAQDLSGMVANNNGNVNSANVGKAFENRQKAETSEGSVQVAATMVLNIQNNTSLAQIDGVNFIEAGGKVSVTSRHDTDGVIMANASATNSTTGVGVAVAINTVTYSNIAEILTDKIKAGEILVQATIYESEVKKTADDFFEAIEKDYLSAEASVKKFLMDMVEASGKGNLEDFIRNYLGSLGVTASKEIENGIMSLLVQWVGELIQGKTPSFPTSQQEDKIKEQVTKYAKEVYDKVKEDFSFPKLKEQLFGKKGILATIKEKIKDIDLMEKASDALVGYLAAKLGGNDEAEGVGPKISTSAVSGAGAANVGVAGSVAISVVNGTSKAYIANAQNGNMAVSGNITVESKASQDVHTNAGASVDALGRVDKNKSATDAANSTQGGNANAVSGKSVGVGAAVALSFADLISDAGIGQGWTITAKDLVMNSSAENNVETTSVAGTDPLARTEKPSDKPDDKLTEEEKKEKEKKEEEQKAAKAMDYAVDASVSVTLIQNAVKAYLAKNSVITLAGNLKMLSSQSGETETNASGFAMGNDTAVGAAVAINLAFSDVLTQFLGSGSVNGTATLDSKTENQDDATAMALAMGAEMERYVAKLRNSEKVIGYNEKKEKENKDEDKDGKADGKIENKTANKISDKLKDASEASGKKAEDKSDPSQPLSVQAIKSQNVKTESTNQTDSGKNNAVGSTVTDAAGANNGNAVSGALNEQAQAGQSIHVAASVGVNVTQHSAKTQIGGNLTVRGLKAEVENTGIFSTASTGAAISESTNSNCIGAAVAVSVNANQAIIEIADGVAITVIATPAPRTPVLRAEPTVDPLVGNVTLSTTLNQNSTDDGLGRYGALAVSGSSSGKGGKVGLAGSIAVLVAKGTSAILLGDHVSFTGGGRSTPVPGTVSMIASDKSKLSAAAMAATKSGGATAGVGASFALLYAQNNVLAKAGDDLTVVAGNFNMAAVKHAITRDDYENALSTKDVISIVKVDSKGNGGYDPDKADDYGMIVLQKNQNGSYNVFTNLNTGNILDAIQMTSILASVNYYASAVAGTVMERKGDTSNQKAAVAGAISMLFNNSMTGVSIGKDAKIRTTGETKITATSNTNTRLLGGALSSSGAKAGIGLNVATAKQKDRVYVTIGNNPAIQAGGLLVSTESISDMLVITAMAVNSSGTSVGGGLNVVINDTSANASVGNNAIIVTTGDVQINAKVDSTVTVGSVTVTLSDGTNKGASVGAIVSVTTNGTAAQALMGNDAVINSKNGSITISAINKELVLSILAAAARSGNGGAGAGTVSVLTTDAKTIAGVGDRAMLTAANDITISAESKARLIDLMLAAAASTDAPAVGATIMVNVFNRDTRATVGNNSNILSKQGNVLVLANSDESAIIVSVAGAAASQNAVSGNIQVNVGNSKTYATIGDSAIIKAWDSIGVTANQNSNVVAISPTVSYASGSTGVGATIQTNILGSDVRALIGNNANLLAYAQNSTTNGVQTQTANRESRRKGIILSALANDLIVAGGVSAVAGKNAAAGVVETLINKTIAIAKLGNYALVQVGFASDDTADSAFSGNAPSEKEGELSVDADAHSTLYLFGGAFSATSGTGVGATVLTLVYDKTVDARLYLDTEIFSHVNGNVSVNAKSDDQVVLISVNFGVSNDTAANVGGNVLIFQNVTNAEHSGYLTSSGNVTVQAESVTNLVNAIASVSGSLSNAAVSGAALVTYFQGITTAIIDKWSKINAITLSVLATSTVKIDSDGVGLTASVGGAAVSGLVNIIVTSTQTNAFVEDVVTINADTVTVIATDHYDLLAVAVSLSGGSNGIGITAVVTVAKNTVLAYIGHGCTINSDTLTVQAVSTRNIRNYAGSVAAGSTAGAGVTVMVAVIGGRLDQDSANGISKGFDSAVFMNGMKSSVPNAAKGYLSNIYLSADISPDDVKASDLHVGDKNGNYNGAEDYRSDDFDKKYNSGNNPGENFSEDTTNTQGSELGIAKPAEDFGNIVHAYIGGGSKITVAKTMLVEAAEKLNVDIVTASAAIGGTAGVNVGVAVVVAYSNVLADMGYNIELNCGDVTIHAVSGGDGSIDDDKASAVLAAAGIDAKTDGSSIRAIAITVGIGGTAGVSPCVAVVNMASSAIARMDGTRGTAGIITVKAEMLYPSVLAVTGAVGAGGSAGVSASVAVVTFNSNTYAGIINTGYLKAAELNVLSNVVNTAKAYAMSIAGGTVGVNGAVAVVTNRSTTNTIIGVGGYEIYSSPIGTYTGNVTVRANVNTNAESYIVGVALGGVAVGLNAAVVNQHAKIVTQILGEDTCYLKVPGNVLVSNEVTATAKATVISAVGGGVGVGGNVLLVFNNMEATAVLNMPFAVTGNVTVSAAMNADSQANLVSGTVGGVAVGLSTSYVGLNAKNLAYLEIPQGAVGKAASIRVYAGNTGSKNSFNATAFTVAGGAGAINVGLNAAVADIHASNEAKIVAKGTLTGNVDVQADALAAALAEIYFASAGGVNVAAATAVSLLRIRQLAEAEISNIEACSTFNVSSALNKNGNNAVKIPSHAKLVTVSGGLYNASANVAVAYSLSQSIAKAILHNGSGMGNITVHAGGAADAKSETLNQSVGVFNGSVYVNVAYANGQFQSLLRIVNQVSAANATVETVYTTNANANLTPSASKLNISLASFDVNLAIARIAAKAVAALEGTGKLVLASNLIVKADGSNSTALANIDGATVNVSGFSFGANVADSQMALEQTVNILHIRVDAGGWITISGDANNLTSKAQTGANGGVGIKIADGKVNSANANVSAVNRIILDNAKLTAKSAIQTKANSNNLAVQAIAKALSFQLSGINAAVTTTEAKVSKFNTGIFIYNGSLTGTNVEAASTATASRVVAQSSVPRFSGSIIGIDSILATAKILEKLTQVIVNAGTIQATAVDAILKANADATLKADSAHPSVSVGAISVKDYRFNIEVDKIRTEVLFDGQIDANDVKLTAYDSITGDIRMDDTTIGGFTGTTGIAKINVKNQTAYVKAAGRIKALGNILVEAKADQKLTAKVNTDSGNFHDHGYAKTDIIIYRNAIVDVDGTLISQNGNIDVKAQLDSNADNNRVIYIDLDIQLDTWFDGSTYPTGTGKLVSVAKVNVAEGSLIQALNVFDGDKAGTVTIVAKSEGKVLVDVYRFVDKVIGGNRAYSVADVSETVQTNIGGSTKTRILGRNVNIRALTEMDVRSKSHAYGNTTITSFYYPNAAVTFRVDLDTIIRSTDISAQNILNISAYLPYTYVLAHCISEKAHWWSYNSPSVTVKGNIYADVTFDNNTSLRARELNVKTFHPYDPNNQVKIERLAQSKYNGKTSNDENTVFNTTASETRNAYGTKNWDKFSKDKKFAPGTYNPSAKNENKIYYSGKLIWSAASHSGATTPSGKTEIYLGAGATGIYVGIDKAGNVNVIGLSSSVNPNALVSVQNGVYHVDGTKLQGATTKGTYSFKFDTVHNSYTMDQSASNSNLTVLNRSEHTLQLNNVNQSSKPGASLNVTQTNANADLIFNSSGNFSTGNIYVDMAGGDLKLLNRAQINAQNILILGVGSIRDLMRNDGKVVITNSGSTGKETESSIDLAVKEALNLILQTVNSRYIIDRIQSGGNLTLEVVNTAGKKMSVVLGELVSGGNVTVTVPHSVESADSNKINISGNAITLNAGGTVGSSSNYLRIDSSVNQIGGVIVKASGGIYLKEASGDLYITEILNTGSGDIAIWIQNGSVHRDPSLNGDPANDYADGLEKLNDYMLKYVEYSQIWSNDGDMIEILAQYMRDLLWIRSALEEAGEAVLEAVKQEIDLLHNVFSVEEALNTITIQLFAIGGTDYQDPDAIIALMNSAVKDGKLTDEFIAEVERLYDDLALGGLFGLTLHDWYDYYLLMNEYYDATMKGFADLKKSTVNISGDGNLYLHLKSATGPVSVSQEINSLLVSIGGKIAITAAENTILKNVYLESYKKIYLDSIVATDVIDLYALEGIYAAENGNKVLLTSDRLVMWSLFGDLGTASQPLIMNVNLLEALGTNVYLQNRKDLIVDMVLATGDLYMTVKGNLNGLDRSEGTLNGIYATGINLQVSGDIGKEGQDVKISPDKYLNVTARNLYMTAEGNVLIGTIRTNGMVSIKADKGTIQNAGPNSGIWCESLYLSAYGMIGTKENPLTIYSNGTYTSNGGGLLRMAFRASVLTGGTLMADSYLYGENIRIIRIVNNPYVPDSDVNSGLPTTTVTDSTSGIQVTGKIEKDAVLVVSNVSDHVDCHVCNQLMQYHNRGGRIFVNLKLLGKYTGKLLVRIPVTGEWAKYEGREIVILTCRDGVVWAIRATLTDGFITFLTEKLGSFLIFGDPDQLELTDDGKSIILNQEILPFGGWL